MRPKAKEFREQKRQEAEERAAARIQRGDAGQLQRLESLGFGECKEAEKLRKKLGKEVVDHASV